MLVSLVSIAAEKSAKEVPPTTAVCPKVTAIAFVCGVDEGNTTYYTNASTYFTNKGTKVVDSVDSVAEIIQWLAQNNTDTIDEIHIVSHGNPWRGMSLTLRKDGNRITNESLQESTLAPLQKKLKKEGKIIFHSCGLGANKPLVKALKKQLLGEQDLAVYASPFFTAFGGKYAAHYLAKPHYAFYPTANSPGPNAMQEQLQNKYPNTAIAWKKTLKNRKEYLYAEAYTYKLNVPIVWEFPEKTAGLSKESDAETIMDWVIAQDELSKTLFQIGIPMEYYRWRYLARENGFAIEAKTTALCVLEPIVDAHKEYQIADTDNRDLYLKL